MGNIRLNPEVFKMSTHKWVPISDSSKFMVDTLTGTIAQSRDVEIRNQLIIRSYQFRVENQEFFVNVLAVLKTGGGNICFGLIQPVEYFAVVEHALLLIENIPLRLPDLGTIKYCEGLYILFQCLKGLSLIIEQFGYIFTDIQQEIIGINEKGQCKIWISANYFKGITIKNELKNLKLKLEKQFQLISQLFSIVQNRMILEMNKVQKQEYVSLKSQYTGIGKRLQHALELVQLLMKINGFDRTKIRLTVPSQFYCYDLQNKKFESLREKISLKKHEIVKRNVFKGNLNPQNKQECCNTSINLSNEASNRKNNRKINSLKSSKEGAVFKGKSLTKNSMCTMSSQNELHYRLNQLRRKNQVLSKRNKFHYF